MLGRFLLRLQQVAPLLALGTENGMPALNSGLARVTGRAERLQIGQVEGAFGRAAHRLDMVDLQPVPPAALDASPAVAAQSF